jgi:hypothetical protein
LENRGIGKGKIKNFSLLYSVQNGPEDLAASYVMGTVNSFPERITTGS